MDSLIVGELKVTEFERVFKDVIESMKIKLSRDETKRTRMTLLSCVSSGHSFSVYRIDPDTTKKTRVASVVVQKKESHKWAYIKAITIEDDYKVKMVVFHELSKRYGLKIKYRWDDRRRLTFINDMARVNSIFMRKAKRVHKDNKNTKQSRNFVIRHKD